MLVMKFGGASVKNADGVRNVGRIVSQYAEDAPVVVVSAMDKTTNALEELAALAVAGKHQDAAEQLNRIRDFHCRTVEELFGDRKLLVLSELDDLFTELEQIVRGLLLLGDSPPRIFDRIMAFGELLSSVVLYRHLREILPSVTKVDARKIIVTDATYKGAEVIRHLTEEAIRKTLLPLKEQIVVTQGYIAATPDGRVTTLGREGSDYTASLLAHALNAKKVVVWKDVPGVMSADPRKYPDAVHLPRLSYDQAVEMTFYGATVIHPKTIKPIQNKGIPLEVRSFVNPEAEGTLIGYTPAENPPPMILHKSKQALITLRPGDFSFMDEGRLQRIFSALRKLNINLVQRSAVSLTVCVDDAAETIRDVVSPLTDEFLTETTSGLSLQTRLYPRDFSVPAGALIIQLNERAIHAVLPD